MEHRDDGAHRRPLVTFGVSLLFLLAFASFTMAVVVARGGDQADDTDDEELPPSENAVAMRNDSFVAASIKVAAGTTVTWANADPAVHTVTSTDRTFVSENLDPGDSYSFTFETAGTYDYVCIFHAGMAGTVVVT
ncbi:MAG: cupredoxin domain-containing protein [Thermomicrobiales bacterium]